MHYDATRCPHCQAIYTPEQLTALRKQKRLATGIGIGCLVLVVLVALFAIFGGGEDVPTETAPVAEERSSVPKVESPEILKAAETRAKEHYAQEQLPRGAPTAPTTGFCRTSACELSKVQFERRDWPKAWQGDYQAQRNAAFCRSTSCDGAVQINLAEACAWRGVILGAHTNVSDDTDAANLRNDCSNLDETANASARLKAAAMFQQIYNRPIP